MLYPISRSGDGQIIRAQFPGTVKHSRFLLKSIKAAGAHCWKKNHASASPGQERDHVRARIRTQNFLALRPKNPMWDSISLQNVFVYWKRRQEVLAVASINHHYHSLHLNWRIMYTIASWHTVSNDIDFIIFCGKDQIQVNCTMPGMLWNSRKQWIIKQLKVS